MGEGRRGLNRGKARLKKKMVARPGNKVQTEHQVKQGHKKGKLGHHNKTKKNILF